MEIRNHRGQVKSNQGKLTNAQQRQAECRKAREWPGGDATLTLHGPDADKLECKVELCTRDVVHGPHGRSLGEGRTRVFSGQWSRPHVFNLSPCEYTMAICHVNGGRIPDVWPELKATPAVPRATNVK